MPDYRSALPTLSPETVILTWNACHIGMIACRNSAGRWYSAMKSLSEWHALRVIMT